MPTTPMTAAEIQQRLEAVIEKMQTTTFEQESDKPILLGSLLRKQGLELSISQINAILGQPHPCAEQIISHHQNKKMATEMAIAVGLIYAQPEMFSAFVTAILLQSLIPKITRTAEEAVGFHTLLRTVHYVSIGLPYTVSMLNTVLHRYDYEGFPQNNFLTQYNPIGLANSAITEGLLSLNSAAYLAAPASVLLYHKGKTLLSYCGSALEKFRSNTPSSSKPKLG